ncbi:hypothetical protein M426DRAFT_18926 [Hypoxylon sp. CI-4A]|nr:hypothetical protein M426DRAFT_18926 [Hypoxylon sp. CI-4A]
MEQQPEVEILVHIGAPSRAADDASYRSLATSYMNFEPTNRIDFPSSQADNSDADNLSAQQHHAQDITAGPPSSGPFGTFRSPQASFRSVIDNANSPRVLARPITEEETTLPSTQLSLEWHTPPSSVQDSYQGNPVHISTLTSPTRVLEHYLQQFDSSQETSSQLSDYDASPHHPSQKLDQSFHEDKVEAPSAPYAPFIVPCTPQDELPSSPRMANGRHLRQNLPLSQQTNDGLTSDNVIEETIVEDSFDPTTITRADSEPLPATHQQSALAGTDVRPLARAISDMGPRSSVDPKSIITIPFLSEHGYTYESLELRAPDPEVSIMDITDDDFITPGLEKLAKALKDPKRYRLKEQARELRPSERGYWLIDCSAWDDQLKRDAWAYLANYVGTGVAGWGIWCTRDPDFQWLRVYCWGVVTAHIYLLLYLASQRRILYTGSSWVDGEGIAVLVTETRS